MFGLALVVHFARSRFVGFDSVLWPSTSLVTAVPKSPMKRS